MYLFLSLKGWQSSILWSVLCRFHSLSHCCHSLSLIAIYCHSLSLVVSLVVILCHSLYHSLSLIVIRCHSLSFVVTRCHSLSLVIIRCHSLYHSLSLVVICCHSLSLDVPLLCLFINDQIIALLHCRNPMLWCHSYPYFFSFSIITRETINVSGIAVIHYFS